MKKLFLFSVAALAFCACSSDEVVSENNAANQHPKEISFSPLAKPNTRAAGSAATNVVNSHDYPSNYTMYVVAYNAGGSDYFGIKDVSGNYTGAGVPFSYQFAGGVENSTANGTYWGGNPPQFWPLSEATLNFLAVSNWGTTTAVSATQPVFGTSGTSYKNLAQKVHVTLGDNKPNASGQQHDLMYAFGQQAVTQTNIPSAVDMTFNHALAWVYFRVKAANSASTAISIKGIQLNGAYYAGTFDAQVNNYSTTSALSWDDENTKWLTATTPSNNYSPKFSESYNTKGASGAATNDSKALQNGTFFNVGDGLLVVPTSEITTPTASITSFDIEYYLNGNLYTYNYVPSVTTFEKGKKYVYDITMTLHEIFVNPSVEDWKDGGTEYVDIPSVAIGTDKTISIPSTAGKYTFQITGLTVDPTFTHNTGEAFPSAPIKSFVTNVATFTFNVNANETGGDKQYTIVVTQADPAKTSTITITQAH